jgi:hypothetical protein
MDHVAVDFFFWNNFVDFKECVIFFHRMICKYDSGKDAETNNIGGNVFLHHPPS